MVELLRRKADPARQRSPRGAISMALHVEIDRDNRVYFTLTCDSCLANFVCCDDACYEFSSLRNEAGYAGWDPGERGRRN